MLRYKNADSSQVEARGILAREYSPLKCIHMMLFPSQPPAHSVDLDPLAPEVSLVSDFVDHRVDVPDLRA
jgi:hypothetical protein